MVERQEDGIEQVTFAEAVKLARTKPERGVERNDLLVRDEVLEPHWHWSRSTGISREEAVARSRNMFYEEVRLVGEESKLDKKKSKKGKKADLEPVFSGISSPSAPEPRQLKKARSGQRIQRPRLEMITDRLVYAELFLAITSVGFSFILQFRLLAVLALAVANGAIIAASVGGKLALRRKSPKGKKARKTNKTLRRKSSTANPADGSPAEPFGPKDDENDQGSPIAESVEPREIKNEGNGQAHESDVPENMVEPREIKNEGNGQAHESESPDNTVESRELESEGND